MSSRRSQIQLYAREAMKRIGQEIAAHGIHAYGRRVTEGPQTLTLYVGLKRLRPRYPGEKIPTLQAQTKKLLGLGDTFALAIGADSATVERRGELFAISIPHPTPWSPTAGELYNHGHGLKIAVGLDPERRPVFIDLPLHPTTLWIGPPGKGKSESMRVTTAIAAGRLSPQRLEIYIAARKAYEWKQFEGLDHVRDLQSEPGEVRRLLEYLAGPVLAERGRTGQKEPAILICVDDLPALLKDDSQIAGPLSKIANDGRALRMFLFVTTQAAGRKEATGSGLMDEAALARIVYKPGKSKQAYEAAGVAGATEHVAALSDRRGDCLAVIDGTFTRLAAGYRDSEILDLIAPPAAMYVEERAEPVTAANHHEPAEPPVSASAGSGVTVDTSDPVTAGYAGYPPVNGRLAPVSVTAAGYDPVSAPPRPTPPPPTTDPGPPTIDGQRDADTLERAAIIAWIHRMTAAGETVSINRVCYDVWNNKNGKIQRWARAIHAEALRTMPDEIAPYEDDQPPAPTAPRPKELDEMTDEEIAAAIAAGKLDLSLIQPAGSK